MYLKLHWAFVAFQFLNRHHMTLNQCILRYITANSFFHYQGDGGMCDTRTGSTPSATTHDDLTELYQNPTTEQEAIISVLGLSGTEIRAYVAVVEHPESKVKHLADVLDRHRRHVARSLRQLHDAGLVERTEKSFDAGGVGYIYSPIPEEEAEQYFQGELQNWLNSVRDELENIDRRIGSETTSFGCSQGSED
jgi:predicted transcriptional regulator